jgi:hypothetical protein
MSLLLATSILALGGVGFYMYKSSDHEYNGSDESSYDEDNLFDGSSSFWGSNEDDEADVDENEYKNFQEEPEPEPYYEPEPKVRARGGKTKTKTKRNTRNVGSKRRY